jgi:predicted secreted protein
MALEDIQLCHVDWLNKAEGTMCVTVWSDDQTQNATFLCDDERSAIMLRNAIRQYAVRLRRVNDFSERHADS